MAGVQYLSAGTYDFYCTIHPEMTGRLTVTSAGAPVTRPNVGVKITSSKLKQVRKSGILKVRLTNSGSDGVADVAATLAGRELGHRNGVAVSGGDTASVSLKLKKAARRALAGRSKAAVKAATTVAFGAPDSAKKTLD